MNQVDKWLELVKKVRRAFNSAKYQEWCFIIGTSGSLKERIELGEKAFEMLKPKSNEVKITNFTSSVVNAVSPMSGDFPMQRGVMKP